MSMKFTIICDIYLIMLQVVTKRGERKTPLRRLEKKMKEYPLRDKNIILKH